MASPIGVVVAGALAKGAQEGIKLLINGVKNLPKVPPKPPI
jgi:hypothetical protein